MIKNHINIILIRHPWTTLVLSILYIIVLRVGTEAYCYWDVPWEADIRRRENGEWPPYARPISPEERFHMIEEHKKQKEELARLIAQSKIKNPLSPVNREPLPISIAKAVPVETPVENISIPNEVTKDSIITTETLILQDFQKEIQNCKSIKDMAPIAMKYMESIIPQHLLSKEEVDFNNPHAKMHKFVAQWVSNVQLESEKEQMTLIYLQAAMFTYDEMMYCNTLDTPAVVEHSLKNKINSLMAQYTTPITEQSEPISNTPIEATQVSSTSIPIESTKSNDDIIKEAIASEMAKPKVNYSQITEFKRIIKNITTNPILGLNELMNDERLEISPQLNQFVLDLYNKVYIELQTHLSKGTRLTNEDTKKIVYEALMTNPHNGVWIVDKPQLQVYDSSFNKILHLYGSHFNSCTTKSSKYIIGTIATITSQIQHEIFNFPTPTPELNDAIYNNVFNPQFFDYMSQVFINSFTRK